MKNVQERKESNGKETGIGRPQFLFSAFVLTNTQKWKAVLLYIFVYMYQGLEHKGGLGMTIDLVI